MSRYPLHYLMRVDQPFLDALDAWRRRQPDIPSRAEAIRRLVQRGLEEEGGEKPV